MEWLNSILSTINDAIELWQDIIFFFIKVFIYLSPIIFLLILFRDKVVRLLSFSTGVRQLEFSDTEVVKNSGSIWRAPLFGGFLFVPPGTNAIIANPKTNLLQSYQPGERVIHFPGLRAFVQYVDIRQRTTDFSVENVLTHDGFQINFDGRISWQVNDVENVSKIKNPVLEIINAVERSIRLTTTQFDHDHLVPHSNQNLINERDFIERIIQSLNSTSLFSLIDLRTIVLRYRAPDPDRNPPPKTPTQAEQDAEAALVRAHNRRELIEIEQEITPLEIEIEKQLTNFADERQQQTDYLALERERSRFNLERERLLIQERKAALTPILRIFSNILSSPGSNQMIDSWSMNRLSRLLENIVIKFWDDPDVVTAEYRTGPRPPENAREKLNYQLVDLWIVDGYIEHRLRELSNGSLGLWVIIKKKQAMFIFDVSGTDPLINRIILKSSRGRICDVPNPGMYNSFTLPETIQKLNDRYHPDRNKDEDQDGCAQWG